MLFLAESEAEEIIRKENFGDHGNFEEYENAKVNDYFTEIAMKIELNENELPTKRTFA